MRRDAARARLSAHAALYRRSDYGGGVGEGAIPLSIGYSDIMPMSQGDAFALVLPSIMLGSLCAIMLSGLLNVIGKRKPEWTGNGRLISLIIPLPHWNSLDDKTFDLSFSLRAVF